VYICYITILLMETKTTVIIMFVVAVNPLKVKVICLCKDSVHTAQQTLSILVINTNLLVAV